jgi:hypothetical protein
MKLYRQRADELYKEQVEHNNKKSEIAGEHVIDNENISIDSIQGAEELGIMADTDEFDPLNE